jgi:hypothetical protein
MSSQHKDYGVLAEKLATQWASIPPSRHDKLEYRPCRTTLNDGRVLECVYVLPAQMYIDFWGVWPEDDSAKRSIAVSDLKEIQESPCRLPPKIASKIYDAGESGMGGCTFTLKFNDQSTQSYNTGNAVDFVQLPPGKQATDIVDVLPHEGEEPFFKGLEYRWCLFGVGKSGGSAKSYSDL